MSDELAAIEEQRAHHSLESEPLRPPDTAAAACGPVEMATSDTNHLQVAYTARARDEGHAPASVPDEQTAPGADSPCRTVGYSGDIQLFLKAQICLLSISMYPKRMKDH